MASVTLKNIFKKYGDIEVVHGVDLTIEDGSFVVLLGPSGCGKSTLLRMIAGLESVTSGDVEIAGKRVNDKHPKDRDIAMVFQNYALYAHMTVKDNMSFSLVLAKRPQLEIDEKTNGRRRSSIWSLTSSGIRGSFPAASASAWRWVAPLFAIRRSSCLMNPCQISMPSSGCRCAPK